MPLNSIVEFRDVSFSYGKNQAVKNLSFSVYENEIFGFLGPNGAGKSTSINLLCRLLKPVSGAIEFNGKNICRYPEGAKKIGLCPQQNVFWPDLTCLEQMQFMGAMYGVKRKYLKSKSEEILKKLALFDRRHTLASNLSGGMKRRLNIALALVHDPVLVILDEPETGLDPQSRVLIRELFRDLSSSKTIILTSHNMDEVERLAQRIGIIDHGSLLALGTSDELKARVGQDDIIELQFETDNSDFASRLREKYNLVQDVDNTFFISSKKSGKDLVEITEMAKRSDTAVKEIKLRPGNLEDVFIALTGKPLRD